VGLDFGMSGGNFFYDYMKQTTFDLLSSNHLNVVNLEVVVKHSGVF
jgi:hypothetical protein